MFSSESDALSATIRWASRFFLLIFLEDVEDAMLSELFSLVIFVDRATLGESGNGLVGTSSNAGAL